MNPSPSRPSISAFFPAYNDGGTIASMVLMAIDTLREATDDFEVIVVNDGSRDYTSDVLSVLAEKFPQLRIIPHQTNKGYGSALISGFANSTKDLIFYTDGDAQYDVREMKLLLKHLTPDVAWVNGYKIARSDPLHRKIIGRIYHWLVKAAFRIPLRDVDCDFRLIRRHVFDKVQLKSESGVICVEMITKFHQAGFKAAEVPVHHFFRAYGKSQFFNFSRVFRVVINLIQLWWQLIATRRAG